MLQIFRGGTVIVTSDSTPANVFELIDRNEATWTFMVPTMWASMVASEAIDRFDLGSLRLLLSGGSPLLTHTKEAIRRRFPNAGLNEFYGGTEVGLVTNLRPEDQGRKVRSVGRPVIGMFVELRDEDGNVVPHGEVGEIHIGGATIIREYFNNPEATAEARKGGFFTLGDMGRFDEEGYLYIVRSEEHMEDLIYRRVRTDPLVFVFPSDHRLASYAAVAPQEIAKEAFLLPSKAAPAVRRVVLEYFNRAGIDLKPEHEVHNVVHAISMITSTRAVMLLPAYTKRYLPESITTRPVKGEVPTLDLVLAYHKANKSPILKLLLSRVGKLAGAS